MKKVNDSSVISGYEWKPGNTGNVGNLVIEFKNSGTYIYEGVDKATYNELDTASSKGQYISTHIRDRYTCEKVEEVAAK